MALSFQRNVQVNKEDQFHKYMSEDSILGSRYVGLLNNNKQQQLIKLLFNSDLDEDDVLHMDSILSTYSEVDHPMVKVFNFISETDYTDRCVPPIEHNFKTGMQIRPHEKYERDAKGLKLHRKYFESELESNLLIQEDYTYQFDVFNEIEQRTKTIKWMTVDETFHETTKSLVKTKYTSQQKREFSIEKRSAILYEMQDLVRGFMVQVLLGGGSTPEEVEAQGIAFIENHKQSFDTFVDEGSPTIVTEITNATEAWLDENISCPQYLIDRWGAVGVTVSNPIMTIRTFVLKVFEAYNA